jgi:hypothetical protein
MQAHMAMIDQGELSGDHLCTKYQLERYCFSVGGAGEEKRVSIGNAGADQLHLTRKEIEQASMPPVIKLRGEARAVVYHPLSKLDDSKFLDYYSDPGAVCTHYSYGLKLKIPNVVATIKLIEIDLHTIQYTCDDPDDNALSAVPVTRTVVTNHTKKASGSLSTLQTTHREDTKVTLHVGHYPLVPTLGPTTDVPNGESPLHFNDLLVFAAIAGLVAAAVESSRRAQVTAGEETPDRGELQPLHHVDEIVPRQSPSNNRAPRRRSSGGTAAATATPDTAKQEEIPQTALELL